MGEIKKIIVNKILGNPLSQEENEMFLRWMNDPANTELFERLKTHKLSKVILEVEDESLGYEMSRKFQVSVRAIKAHHRKTIVARVAITVSAAALIAVSFLIFNPNNKSEIEKAIIAQNSTIVEDNRATDSIKLITASGILNLDKEDDYTTIVKKSEMISTSMSEDTTQIKPQINTLIVPIKRVYNFTLPDGSKVWINSGSQLKFPETFSDSLRWVELEGEAYFEIVKNNKAPFIVKTNKLNTHVLGTQFMVSCYEEEYEVSLIEGSVRVNRNGSKQNMVLKPGRGALLDKETKELKEVVINIEKIEGRKNGLLIFDEEKLSDIADDLSRWYGVEFAYETEELKNQTFYIKINRFDNIQYIMQLLRYTKKIDYTIKENRIFIKSYMPMTK